MNDKDLNKLRGITSLLSHTVPINPDPRFGIVSHPFTNTAFYPKETKKKVKNEKGEECEMLQFWDLTKEEDQREWLKWMDDRIMKMDLIHIRINLNTPYLLTWLKYTRECFTKEEFSEYFADAWVASENPNDDINVSIPELIKWFKESDKQALMVTGEEGDNDRFDDLNVYKNIPETITLYRGVSKQRHPFGLSYTASKEKAEWFQNRFHNGEGFLITLEVKKKDVLAYFNTRGEDEYVVDVSKYKEEIIKQVPKNRELRLPKGWRINKSKDSRKDGREQ